MAEIDDPSAQVGVLCGSHTGAGGTVTAYVRLEGPARDRIREVLITGDFFVTPPRMVFDLEAHTRHVSIAAMAATVERFFADTRIGLLSVAPSDFRAAIEAALAAR